MIFTIKRMIWNSEKSEVTEERGRYLVDFRVAKEIIDQEGGDPESPVEA